MKKNLKKVVPFVTALCVFAFVVMGCHNMVLAELLRNHRKIQPQPELSDFKLEVEYINPILRPNLTPIDARPSQIYPQAQLIDYVVKVPYGTTRATVKDIVVETAGGSIDFTLSPQGGTMALPSKKPVTITVPEAGKSPKVYSVYFVVCPEAYYVAAYGDDRNPGDTKERPFKQLKTALDAASNSRVVNKVVVIGTLDKGNAKGLEGNSHTFNLNGYGLSDASQVPPGQDGKITISGMNEATLKSDGIPKGVMLIRDSYLIFENITITGGFATVPVSNNICGGGLAIYGNSDITLSYGTRVIGNTAVESGGGIYAYEIKALTIRGAEISNNEVTLAYFGGGGLCTYNFAPSIDNSLFSGNKVRDESLLGYGRGGGIVIMARGTTLTVPITNCTFSANTAKSTYAAVYKALISASVSFNRTGSVFVANYADDGTLDNGP